MSQKFKNIYFADYPGDSPQKKNLTVAFGDKDEKLYQTIRTLSSHELREMIGCSTFSALRQSAEQEGLATNTYCLRLLRQKVTPRREEKFAIDPIQATFKGGQAEPLHAWYPLLEGYSPRFVEQVLGEFAPQATRILDPFAGTGTTPLTVARLGKAGFYCEINPLLQFLAEVKADALGMNETTRNRMSNSLLTLAGELETLLENALPDSRLAQAYTDSFSDSRFFDNKTFDQVLRMRSAIDRLSRTEPIIARFLTVAVLASLIPASRLIRRGDVRFKTAVEAERCRVKFLAAAQNQLTRIALDLKALTPFVNRPMLVCEDARALVSLPPLNIEAVITSPPYLNGTNYFRNTKIELWFLRCLNSSTDLTAFRRKAVTAGINDVTVDKPSDEIDPSVRKVIERLEESAYDPRIPKMVASFFMDMRSVFSAVRKHLINDATILIDIGDSSYGNVHVPTDILLENVLASLDFTLQRKIILRRRMSRSGFPLNQVLLAFELSKPSRRALREAQAAPLASSWNAAWTKFKSDLPHQRGAFAKRNWGHPLHSLCSYQGKMKPSLASHLVRTFLPSGGTLLDPFAGVGTIPFEVALQGGKAIAFEISPPALQISSAKLGRPNANDCAALLDTLNIFIRDQNVTETEIEKAKAIHFNGALPDYFEFKTFHQILLARRYFLDHPPHTPSESLVLASLLHILHGNRPYALSRRSHPITPFAPTGTVEHRALIPRLRDKINRSLMVACPSEFVQGDVYFQDATGWWPHPVDQLDAIITSPPFFNSTRFYLANWMRLWFCGWEAQDFRTQPLAFVDERQKNSFEIYAPIFRQARERLKSSGVVVFHLGKSRKCDMAQALAQIASRWFRVIDIFAENVSHCESHGIRDKGTVEEHQYLILQ